MKNFLSLLLFILIISASYAFDAKDTFTKTCATCHTIGGGDKIGPDLAGIGKRRTVEWLHKYINYPTGMIMGDEEEPGYEKPDADAKAVYELYKPQIMAEQTMTKDQVKAMVAYIDSQKKEPKGKILKLIKGAKKEVKKEVKKAAPAKK